MSTENSGHYTRSFSRNPTDPPGIPGYETHASPPWDIYVFNWKSWAASRRGRREDRQLPRLRQRHHSGHREERQGRRPPLHTELREALPPARRGLLARRRHGRRLLAGPISTSRISTRTSTSGTRTGRSGPIRSVPPAKFIHDEGRRRGSAVIVAGLRRLPSSRAPISADSLLFTQVPPNSYAVLDHVVALPYVNGRPLGMAHEMRRSTGGSRYPPASSWRKTPRKTRNGSGSPRPGVTLITQNMLDRRAAPRQ